MKVPDAFGVGSGPANLAVAVALEEDLYASSPALRGAHLFADARTTPIWHPGLLFPESTMQISFLKDLATTADPRSSFTFLNTCTGRGAYTNSSIYAPSTRAAWSSIRTCVGAARLAHLVRFGCRVQRIDLEAPEDPAHSRLGISTVCEATGQEERFSARCLILADGGYPLWPLPKPPSDFRRIFHGSVTLERLKELGIGQEARLVFHIVGSGQSAVPLAASGCSRNSNSSRTLAAP